MLFDHLAGNGQTQPHAAEQVFSDLVYMEKAVIDARQHISGDADALVLNADAQPAVFRSADGDQHPCRRWG